MTSKVSAVRILPLLIENIARGFFMLASVAMSPVTDSVFHEPVDLMIGVTPLFPQVLRIGGFSEYPDSSQNTKIK